MQWTLLASGAVGALIAAPLWPEGVAGQALLGIGLLVLLASMAFSARRRVAVGAMTLPERGLWAAITGASAGWAAGLALGTLPGLLTGETYEILDPAVYLSGLGLVLGLCVGAAVALGLVTRARD